MSEPMDYRTAIGIEMAFDRLRYNERLAEEYRAKAEAAAGSYEAQVFWAMSTAYETAAGAVSDVLAGFEGAFDAKSRDALAEMAAEAARVSA